MTARLRSSRTDAESGHLGGAGRIISECRLLAAINHGLSGSSVSGGPAWVAHETPCPHSVTARDPALYTAVMSKRKHTGRSDLLKFHRPQLRLDNAPIPTLKPESKQYVRVLHPLPDASNCLEDVFTTSFSTFPRVTPSRSNILFRTSGVPQC